MSTPCQKTPVPNNKSAILKLPKTLCFARNNLQDSQLKPNNPVQIIALPLNNDPQPQAIFQPQTIPQPQVMTQPQLTMVQDMQPPIMVQPVFEPQYYNMMEPVTEQVFSQSLDYSLEQEESSVQWDEFLQPIIKNDNTDNTLLGSPGNALMNVGSPDSGLGVDSLLNTVDEFSDFSDLNDENLGEVDLFSDIYFS